MHLSMKHFMSVGAHCFVTLVLWPIMMCLTDAGLKGRHIHKQNYTCRYICYLIVKLVCFLQRCTTQPMDSYSMSDHHCGVHDICPLVVLVALKLSFEGGREGSREWGGGKYVVKQLSSTCSASCDDAERHRLHARATVASIENCSHDFNHKFIPGSMSRVMQDLHRPP